MVSNLAAGVTAFTSNAFLVPGERTVLVDTGANFDIVSALRERGGLDAVVLTHTHPDHVANLDAVKSAFNVAAWAYDTDHDGVDHGIGDGEFVQLGDHEYRALYTPGHKNDHLCLFSRESGILFAGDLVFANGGFGRTDLDEGDRALLVESIEYVLDTIGEDATEMYTGHGPSVPDPRPDIELALQGARFG
jgi:glyoxylase-like metal-dependent hydrolase (beta-lactamase superfamily II)